MKEALNTEDIKRIVKIADDLLTKDYKDKYISEEDYYEEILKRYNEKP